MSPPSHAILETFDDTKLLALVELLYLAAHADGEFSAEERKQFFDSIKLLTRKRLSVTVLDPLFARIQHDIDTAGRAERLATVKERLGSEGACRAALTFIVTLMAADGILRTSEREIIPEIANALGLGPDAAADEVSAIFGNHQE